MSLSTKIISLSFHKLLVENVFINISVTRMIIVLFEIKQANHLVILELNLLIRYIIKFSFGDTNAWLSRSFHNLWSFFTKDFSCF